MKIKRTRVCSAGCLSAVEVDKNAWPHEVPIINGNWKLISWAGQDNSEMSNTT